jgi:hypothetical protein
VQNRIKNDKKAQKMTKAGKSDTSLFFFGWKLPKK